MQQLTPKQWSDLERMIFEVHEAKSIDDLREWILHQLPSQIGSHFASWNAHNEHMYLTEVRNSSSHEVSVGQKVAVLNEALPSHPCFQYFMDFSTGQVRYIDTVERTRDHAADDVYHATPFYQLMARHFQIEDQLLMHVGVEGGDGVILTFHFLDLVSAAVHLQTAILRGHIVVQYHRLCDREVGRSQSDEILLEKLRTQLTKRERQVLLPLCEGKSNGEIALELGVSSRTIDKHVEHIFQKLNLRNRTTVIAKFAALVHGSTGTPS